MPSSPKSPRTPNHFDFGRNHSGKRWHSRRRFFFLFSVVLLISTGSLLMLRLSVDPNSLNSPSWTRPRIPYSPLRNNNNHDNNNDSDSKDNNKSELHAGDELNPSADKSTYMYSNPYLTRGGQRPRQALPHRNVFNDEKELALMMDQLELQEQQLRQLRQQILDQQKEIKELDLHRQVLLQKQEEPQPPKGRQEAPLQGLLHPSGTDLDPTNDHTKSSTNSHEPGQSPLQDSNSFELGAADDGEFEAEEAKRAAFLEFSRENPLPFTKALEKKLSTTARTKARGTRYLTYLPYAGITNQFYGMLRALEVADALGRTLILPPITASSHDKSKQNQPWSRFLDLDRFRSLTGAKVIEYHELLLSEGQHHEDTIQEYHLLQCKITCGFGSKRTIDFTAKGFLKQWHLQESLVPLQTVAKDDSSFESIVAALQPFKDDPYLCLSNTYKIAIKDKTEWERFGQHLYFTTELEQFVQQFLVANRLASTAASGFIQPYLAIHARRGDFAKYCEGNFPGRKMIHCLPSTSQFEARIDIIQSDLTQAMAVSDHLPVFVATNERDPDELAQFAQLGWHVLDHEAMKTVESLGVFGPMMVDQVFMANAQVLVGIQMSTFSRVGALRQKSWHGREAEYM
ncbi:hypothetical protein EMPS_01428 [Entomortierella parvispora]|uniref:GDP-fucose protein O-fucosyltransferase 2 n=1 Tax=Entomortierella parvispora TaxID=205924 RepID=A0A9P3LST0_9FUNG|nr:hypothetical protein EMPS_01428 [Entomortierella parvispora]